MLVIAVVVIVALLVVADRVGVSIAERVAGETLQSSQHLSSRPDVDIAGFPFLTQLATGRYDQITVTAHDVPVSRSAPRLVIDRLRVVLNDLRVSRSFSRFHADTAKATGTIGFGPLGGALGVQLSYAGDGRVQASKTVSFAGQSVSATLTAHPRLVNGALAFDDVSVEGDLAQALVDSLARFFAITIPLQGIPFDVQLQSLTAGPDGVTVTLTGDDLLYVR